MQVSSGKEWKKKYSASKEKKDKLAQWSEQTKKKAASVNPLKFMSPSKMKTKEAATQTSDEVLQIHKYTK